MSRTKHHVRYPTIRLLAASLFLYYLLNTLTHGLSVRPAHRSGQSRWNPFSYRLTPDGFADGEFGWIIKFLTFQKQKWMTIKKGLSYQSLLKYNKHPHLSDKNLFLDHCEKRKRVINISPPINRPTLGIWRSVCRNMSLKRRIRYRKSPLLDLGRPTNGVLTLNWTEVKSQ